MNTDPLRSYGARRVGLGILSVGAAVAAFLPVSLRAGSPPPVPTATPAPALAPTPTPVPRFRPLRIELPTLQVAAPIIAVGIDADGAMGTPKTAHEVAWWDGVMAGEGNALLAGHRDWRRRPGSFYRLSELRPGDLIRVVGEGGELTFVVEWVRQMPGDAEAAHILGDQGAPVVTLITCGGEFDRRVRHYKDRVVVRGVLA